MMNWNSKQYYKKILISFAGTEFNALVMQNSNFYSRRIMKVINYSEICYSKYSFYISNLSQQL